MAIILKIILMSEVNKSVMSQELHGIRGRSVGKKRCKETPVKLSNICSLPVT